MVRGIVVFGGIWAATAASVTLVRYPFSEEPLGEGEVETLDPREFVSQSDEQGPFASKYPNYFAAATKVNKKFWEDRFDNKKKQGNDKIEVDHHSGSKAEIVSVWDDPENKQQGLSLVGFCREGYSTKASFDKHHEWFFSHSSDDHKVKVNSDFWSLCSVFGSKPETLKNRYDDTDKDPTISNFEGQLGSSEPYRLVKADKNHAFWYIREQEWQSTDVSDSYYFGNDKKSEHTIRELCEFAYSKNSSDKENEDIPDLDDLDKYCGLEWVWD